MASGSGNGSGLEFGKTEVVPARGTHKATIVWLHDIGLNGVDSARFVSNLGLQNIKWICPTAPKRPITYFGGFETTAWCDISEISEDMQDDVGSLYSVASFVATLLSSEPVHVMKGVGGIGLGAANALYFGSLCAFESIPITLKVVVGLKGWLPGLRNLQDKLRSSPGAANRAAPILLTHGISNYTIPFPFVHKCFHSLLMAGFPIMFKKEPNLDEVCVWLTRHLER